jgi:hypothetical protein
MAVLEVTTAEGVAEEAASAVVILKRCELEIGGIEREVEDVEP